MKSQRWAEGKEANNLITGAADPKPPQPTKSEMKNEEKKALLNQVQTLLNKNGISGHKLIPFMTDLSQHIGSPESEDYDNGFRGNPKIAAFYRRRRMNAKTKVGSVVQVNESGPEGWQGCLVQVSEMKSWGIQGWVKIPLQGDAYIRLKTVTFDYIGEAVMVPADENDEA